MNVTKLQDLRKLNVGNEERRKILGHVFDSDVWYLACQVKSGKLSLWTGVLTDISELGDTKTFFGELGSLSAQTLFGRDKFLVREVYDLVHSQRCNCDEDRRSSDWLKAEIGKDAFIPLITFHQGWGHIADGNHSASSFYEVHKGAEAIELAVYVLR